jgi:acyl-CoA synthetase (AMP-forming)/AMP-acid ligase II
MLLRQVESRPQHTAFIFENEIWTYERLASQASRLAGGLSRLGLRKGERVALHMTNRPEMLVAYYACFQLGLIAAPLRTAFTPAELIPLLERLQPALYIGEVALYNNVAAMDEGELPFARRFVVGGSVDDFRVENWQKLFDGDAYAKSPTDVDVNAPAVLINTSGTTGVPKFVTHTLATLAATAEMIVRHWPFESSDVLVEQLPLVHSSGLVTFITAIHLGAPFVLLKTFDPDIILDTIEQHHCTMMLGFPATYAALVERQSARPRNLQSLRFCATAGDICPTDLQTRASAVLGTTVFNVWGATEVVGSFAYGLQPGPVSRVLDGAQIRLIDDGGVEVPHGEIGELLIRGPNVFVGYWNGAGGKFEGLEDGWYHTGDLMRHGDGNDMWFVGRKKDIIIRGGTNISPIEIENALLAAHPAILEAGVVGVPDRALGERVVGFVKLAPNAADSVVADILSSLAGRLAAYKIPERLMVIDKLPRNALSKVDRKALAKLAAASHADAVGNPAKDAPVPAGGDNARPSRRVARG